MTPETVMAFFLFLAIAGIAGVAYYVYWLQGKCNGRLDALNNLLDSVDERLSERSNDFTRCSKEVKSRQATLDEKVSQERLDREAITAELFKKNDEIQEGLNKIQEGLDEIRGRIDSNLTASKEDLERTTASLQIALRGDHDAFEERLGALTAILEVQKSDLEGYAAVVWEVRAANLIHLALQYLASHQPEEASRLMRMILHETPNQLEARVIGVRADIIRGSLPEARELIEAGLALHPDEPSLLTESVRIYRMEKNRGERARVLSEGLTKFPDHPGLLFERSLQSAESHRYEAAKADLEKLISLGHETAELRYNLGVVFVALGDFPRAIAELRKSLALDPVSADTNHSLGLALMHGERYLEAVDFLERARELLPSTVSIRLDLAAALRQSGQAEESLRECAVARHLNPSVLRTGLEEALAYQYLGQFNEALVCLDGVLHMSPKMQRARRIKAEILTIIERYREAADEWNRMVQDTPNDAYLQATLGEAMKKAGQDSAALECLEKAARMAPNSTSIQVSFAREALAQHKYELVHEVTEQAYPRAATAENRLQFLEIRFLLALISNRWISLVPLLNELGHLLGEYPHILPMPEDSRIDSQTILHLGLAREATRIHSALLDLLDGAIQFPDFEELVARVMRSMLPVKPPPKPAAPIEPATPELSQPVEVLPTPLAETPPPIEPTPMPVIEEPIPIVEAVAPEFTAESVFMEQPMVVETSPEPVAAVSPEVIVGVEAEHTGTTESTPVDSVTEAEPPAGPHTQPHPQKQKKRDHHHHKKG